jgi:hypothetical protein
MGETANKTFGLATPRDLLAKLQYDIHRIGSATTSDELNYAAFDCAVDASHLTDWVLSAVDDERHFLLSGEKRLSFQAADGFVKRQSERIPALRICRDLANGVKHFEQKKSLPNVSISRIPSVIVVFDENSSQVSSMRPSSYIEIDGKGKEVFSFFSEAHLQWERFLSEERIDRKSFTRSYIKKN